MEEGIRVRMDKREQREIFIKFINKFRNKMDAARYLGITKHNLYDYSNCRTSYMPNNVLEKISNKLANENFRIIDKKSLKEIRKECANRATMALKNKYGDDWKKILNQGSRKALYEKYGKDAYKKITRKGHKVCEEKYGKDWLRILSQKGIESLKRRYGKNWYDTTLAKGREKLKEKYGTKWQKELSKLAMKSLREKYANQSEKRHSNIKTLFKNRNLTKSEGLISRYLSAENVKFKTNMIKNNLEFDIVIPDENNPRYVIEISDIKPTTYNQRIKTLKLYYQKLTFPDAQHIAILKGCSFKNGKKYSLHKITKDFLDKEEIVLLSLEKIDKHIEKLIECIKNNRKINIREEFLFCKKTMSNSKKGCIVQSKKINKDELELNRILINIGALAKGPQVIKIKGKSFICVDNFEIYNKNKIAYEITSSNSNNSLRALAGKILLCKEFNEDMRFIVILSNPVIYNNVSVEFLRDLSDQLILRKGFNESNLIDVREKIVSQT